MATKYSAELIDYVETSKYLRVKVRQGMRDQKDGPDLQRQARRIHETQVDILRKNPALRREIAGFVKK